MLRHVRMDLSHFADSMPWLNVTQSTRNFSVRMGSDGEVIIVAFIWRGGGKHVKLCGSFDSYVQHALHRTASGYFGIVLELLPGR